jgi:hypothetical protein
VASQAPRPVRPTAHDAHDVERVAAFAARDLDAATADRIGRQVDACPNCTQLVRDLMALRAAMRDLPPPAFAARDFRLTPSDAARLTRPDLPGRLVSLLAGRRAAFAPRLGGALAALGLVLVVLSSTALSGVGFLGAGGSPATAPKSEYQAGSGSTDRAAATVAPSPFASAEAAVGPAATGAGGEIAAPGATVAGASQAPGPSAPALDASSPEGAWVDPEATRFLGVLLLVAGAGLLGARGAALALRRGRREPGA